MARASPRMRPFTVEVERSLRVLDGAVGVFCAKGGVEPQSENVWRQADTYNVPRMAFINKMDILGANFYAAVDQIRTRLGKNAICLQLPIGKEDEFKGIIDLFEMKAYIYNDEKGDNITVTDDLGDMKDDAETYRAELIEKICELDDDLMMMYLENGVYKKALVIGAETLSKIMDWNDRSTCVLFGDGACVKIHVQKTSILIVPVRLRHLRAGLRASECYRTKPCDRRQIGNG